ncbi:hypothetical protein C4D60_Mb03t11840 [Musa balbisiana]|uniref:Uncharacterized protein n=1 Tax=Musa balbisiana TaxID=52838 RepID=A0A4S8J978_MUSBA|nr:hypothetical protein C4D60_Mb03t11840 [Musa balbisiana]
MGLHLHLPHKIMAGHGRRRGEEEEGIRKGWMGIRVGGEGEERQRFVVPVDYLSHPLFVGLLKEAEEEYGFDHQGAITIPCHVEHFRRVQDIIDRDCNSVAAGHHHHGHHHHHHHHHHFHLCFRA